MELVIFIGLQASGKSTFYRSHFALTHDWVSRDHFPKARNRNARIARLVAASLRAGRSVVLDNTNPMIAERAQWIGIGRAHGARIVGYYFQSSAADCIARNAERDDRSRVPVVAIYDTRKKLQLPARSEGFDRLFYVSLNTEGFDIQEWMDDENA